MLKYAQVMPYMLKLFGLFIQTTFHKQSVFLNKGGVVRPQNLCILTKKRVSSQADNQRKRGIFYFEER